ncbi:MAG: dockerin type I repeat-containing protein [Chloroflexi bacterium]|nr:dockerin type I repeat-containing protein [Chloroflexota bacterium]
MVRRAPADGFERTKSGISGVATQLAVARVYDDLAPGAWISDTIVITGQQALRSVAQLIDPVGELRAPVDITVNGSPGLPAEIQTERRLFGGGLAIVGNKNNPDLALPFALRSRISFDDAAGELVFRGYYDGASPEYIKGDPLLLLNVMAKSDKERLQSLCAGGGATYPFDATDCGKYKKAVEDLYWQTLNPRQLDLCRDSAGKLAPDDPEPATNQKAKAAGMTVCRTEGAIVYYRDGLPDRAFLISVQDANDDGIPEPYAGLGKGKALSAGNAAGTGYVTLAYNNDQSLGGLPVSLQVIKVGCEQNAQGDDSTYRGNLLVIKSDNLFDEKLTLRHTGDFGGRPDNFTYEWWIAAVDETAVSPTALPPSYPWSRWTKIEPGAGALGPEITIEGANPTTLRDNWLIMRYQGYNVCGNKYRYSAFAGDPSAKPSEVRAQLAEGWIKRVTNALNPYDARVKDFVSSPVNTTVDMISQAGERYEGPIAMSSDPDTLNSVGLIEAYQTVLERGRDLSIDSNVNDQGANAALLNVTSRISDLYMLLANDAYADALDPTVGLGTTSSLGSRTSSAFAFMNQFRPDSFGLIDEELALLRGRDETLGGVAAAPTYNRLTWNFTNGEGEVAYVMNYNVKDVNGDGFVNEADAAILYPQGHGDAWGHYLTAITKYYELLRHPNYTWSPRAEPVSVAGAPVVVDYYDERRFATDAAAKARVGAEIVDLAYRKMYAEPTSQEYVDTHVDASDGQLRAWGVADWARRAGQGAYFDWVVGNAILPPVDERYSDVRKIDRTTVTELKDIADQYAAIQQELDKADSGANPLGLAPNAVLFDLDPSKTQTTPTAQGQTHFEQVFDRAAGALDNALKSFNYANEMKIALRDAQNEHRDFVDAIVDEDRNRINELIDIFGYPYDADLGVNGTYPAGYTGPDVYNYDLVDRSELTDSEKRCSARDIGTPACGPKVTTYTLDYAPLKCIGDYVEAVGSGSNSQNLVLCAPMQDETKQITYTVGIGLDAGYGRFKPANWSASSARPGVGEIQVKLGSLYSAKVSYEAAILNYQNQVEQIEEFQNAIDDRAEVLDKEGKLSNAARWTVFSLKTVALVLKEIAFGMKQSENKAWDAAVAAKECLPTTLGLSSDTTSIARCAALFAGNIASGVMGGWEIAASAGEDAADFSAEIADRALETDLFKLESDYELRQLGRELQGLLRDEKGLRLELYLAADAYAGAMDDYKTTVQRGFSRLNELSLLRQRWAGQVTEQRYGDMAYRIFQNDALQKYRQEFDLTQLYTYLTAAAYDYETNLAGSDPANGDQFLRQIVGMRSLGQVSYAGDGTLQPIPGSHGLAGPLGQMRDNFVVLKGQMGFNNPQAEVNRFSLRQELFRLRDASDATWRQTLQRYYTADIYADDAVAKLAKRPYGETSRVPGLVIPFGTIIKDGLNFFGQPLGPGDSAYDATQFATKIANVGIWFEGYDTARLANTPRVYLLPAGADVVRPRSTNGVLRYWRVAEQLLPVPYPLSPDDMANPDWISRINGLNGDIFAIKPYARLRAYPFSEDLEPDELNTDTRLIGRSVWNTEWLLVIPGTTLLADPEMGIERFVQDVDDIYLYFQTYAYAGTAAAAQAKAKAETGTASTSALTSASTSAAQPLPLPDVLFYGTTARNNEPLTSGTVKAILPRGAIVSVDVAPIQGANYTYALTVPLSQYNPDLGAYATDSARPGETIHFLVNDTPATFRDANGATTDQFVIPANGIGRPYRLDQALVGPDSYPLGDVNANGLRNSADALLILKYDVGLIAGDTNFPPGPGKIYLPLCDIVQDGRCNSGDALRVLQCDAQMPGVSCPSRPTVATQTFEVSETSKVFAAPTPTASLVFRPELLHGPAADQVTVGCSRWGPRRSNCTTMPPAWLWRRARPTPRTRSTARSATRRTARIPCG